MILRLYKRQGQPSEIPMEQIEDTEQAVEQAIVDMLPDIAREYGHSFDHADDYTDLAIEVENNPYITIAGYKTYTVKINITLPGDAGTHTWYPSVQRDVRSE